MQRRKKLMQRPQPAVVQPRVPDISLAWLAALMTFSSCGWAQLPAELGDNWYRTELVIFLRAGAELESDEQWDPLPELSYPSDYRFFIDPTLADRRVTESEAFASGFDERGVQRLIVGAPLETLLEGNRPDGLLIEPELPADPNAPDAALDPNTPTLDSGIDPSVNLSDMDSPLDPNAPLDTVERVLLALPYELLDPSTLEFRREVRALRRRGDRVMFHGAWWAPLDDAESTQALVIDHAGDLDVSNWPELQGSISIYLTRYLHINVDLWLNTEGAYLPEGWQIPPAPSPSSSLLAETLAGVETDPWRAPLSIETLYAELEGSVAVAVDPDSGLDAPASDLVVDTADEKTLYSWRHAIRHRQERRMRSQEIHYLDHPVIGVIVRIVPAGDDALPFMPATEEAFRERHGLPLDYLELDEDAEASQ